jgi:5-methylcytosine-specific restriction endonuclease McrA
MPRAPTTHRLQGQPAPRRKPAIDLRDGFRGRKRQEAKARVFIRDGARCQGCKRITSEEESHLDHIIPLSAGGSHADKNLQTLCHRCSKVKTASEQRRGGGRKV